MYLYDFYSRGTDIPNKSEQIKKNRGTEEKEKPSDNLKIITAVNDNKDDIKYLYFGKNRKYGVNWKKIESGVKITRISIGGTFYKGGIRNGDILTKINGFKIINGDKLDQETNKLFSEKIDYADLKVKRGDQYLFFRLIN